MSEPEKLFVRLFFASELLLNLFGLANGPWEQWQSNTGRTEKYISSVGVQLGECPQHEMTRLLTEPSVAGEAQHLH